MGHIGAQIYIFVKVGNIEKVGHIGQKTYISKRRVNWGTNKNAILKWGKWGKGVNHLLATTTLKK